jgi:hypothetical protein
MNNTPNLNAFLATMQPGEMRQIPGTNETLARSRDGCYTLPLRADSGRYLHTDPAEAARVEALLTPAPAPKPTKNRKQPALTYGAGATWSREEFRVYSRQATTAFWSFGHGYTSFEDAQAAIFKAQGAREAQLKAGETANAERYYRIVRVTTNCEVLA